MRTGTSGPSEEAGEALRRLAQFGQLKTKGNEARRGGGSDGRKEKGAIVRARFERTRTKNKSVLRTASRQNEQRRQDARSPAGKVQGWSVSFRHWRYQDANKITASLSKVLYANKTENKTTLDRRKEKDDQIESHLDGSPKTLANGSENLLGNIGVLNRFVGGDLCHFDIESWANAVESREDIEFECDHKMSLKDIIFQLANPYLSEPLTDELARSFISRIASKNV